MPSYVKKQAELSENGILQKVSHKTTQNLSFPSPPLSPPARLPAQAVYPRLLGGEYRLIIVAEKRTRRCAFQLFTLSVIYGTISQYLQDFTYKSNIKEILWTLAN